MIISKEEFDTKLEEASELIYNRTKQFKADSTIVCFVDDKPRTKADIEKYLQERREERQ